MDVRRCVSCDGYGWYEDEFTGETSDCDWCGGTGYIYRDENGVDHKIPEADYGKVSGLLEKLEAERLRDMGYTGSAKRPQEQEIRKGTKLAQDPDDLISP
jgi:hypothetical protein